MLRAARSATLFPGDVASWPLANGNGPEHEHKGRVTFVGRSVATLAIPRANHLCSPLQPTTTLNLAEV